MVKRTANTLMNATDFAVNNRSKVRVLYFLSYPRRMAGVNRALLELIKNLPPAIHPVVIFAGEGHASAAYREAGVETYIVPQRGQLNIFGKAVFRWSWRRRLAVALRDYAPYALRIWKYLQILQPDLVHIHEPRGAILMGVVARAGGWPVVGHLHGERPFGGLLWQIFEWVSHRIIMVASALQSSLSPGAQAKSTTVYLGVEDQRGFSPPVGWLEELRARGISIVCCFASVEPFKGHHHLLKAVAELNRRGWGGRSMFVCVGDYVPEYSDYHRWLARQQQELGVDNVVFTGWQSNPFGYYEAADIAVLPSVSEEQLFFDDKIISVKGNEGFPRTHLEAMCYSLPIVGTDIAGVREQIEHGVNGFVVKPGDYLALADALEALLADPDLRASMGRAGREKALQKFSIDAYVAGTVAVYRQLVPRLVAHQD